MLPKVILLLLFLGTFQHQIFSSQPHQIVEPRPELQFLQQEPKIEDLSQIGTPFNLFPSLSETALAEETGKEDSRQILSDTSQPSPSLSLFMTETKWQCVTNRYESRSLFKILFKEFATYKIDTFDRISLFITFSYLITAGFTNFKEYTNPDGKNPFCSTYDGGCNYIGRGLITIRGKQNYQLVAAGTGIDCVNNPIILEDPELAIKASVFYWVEKDFNHLADRLLPLELYYQIFQVWPDDEALQAFSGHYQKITDCFQGSPAEKQKENEKVSGQKRSLSNTKV